MKFWYTDETPFPWGAHKGKQMQDVPAKYLLWLEIQSWFSPDKKGTHYYIKKYIDDNRDVIEHEAKEGK